MITANQIHEQARRLQLELPRQAEVIVANAVDAEPLLGSTAASLAERPVAAVLGLRLAMLASGARYGIFALRSKVAAQALSTELRGAPELQLMRTDDRYFVVLHHCSLHIFHCADPRFRLPESIFTLSR